MYMWEHVYQPGYRYGGMHECICYIRKTHKYEPSSPHVTLGVTMLIYNRTPDEVRQTLMEDDEWRAVEVRNAFLFNGNLTDSEMIPSRHS